MTTETNAPVSKQCCELNPGPWNMLAAMLPTANWTADAEAGRVTRAVAARHTDVYDRLARAQFRRERRHVLLTGDKGVGKTAVVRELARRGAAGEIPFLADTQFLWIDAGFHRRDSIAESLPTWVPLALPVPLCGRLSAGVWWDARCCPNEEQFKCQAEQAWDVQISIESSCERTPSCRKQKRQQGRTPIRSLLY